MKFKFKKEEMSNEKLSELVKEKTGYGFKEAIEIAAKAVIAAVEITNENSDKKYRKDIHEEDGTLTLGGLTSAFKCLTDYGEDALNKVNGSKWDMIKFVKFMEEHTKSE